MASFLPIFITLIALFFLALFFQGAPFFPSRKKTIEKMIKLAKIKPGEMAADLGSGDGRVVFAMAQAGAEAHGYEINPLLVWLSRRKIKKANLAGRAFVHWKDFWREDLSSFNIIVIFGINHIMPRLEKKLREELKPGARVISNGFTFPNWSFSEKDGGVYLYPHT